MSFEMKHAGDMQPNQSIINESDSESDDTYINNTLSHRALCYVLPIIHPFQGCKVIWDFFIVLLLLFSCLTIPFALAFDITVNHNDAKGIIVLLIDIFLCIDILITFRTAYYAKDDPLRLITCPISIAERYLRFWFWFDLITSWPFDYIMGVWSSGLDYTDYIKVLRLIRLIRIFRIIRVVRYTRSSKTMRFSPSFMYKVEIFKIIFSMAFVAHCFACLWYSVGVWMIEFKDVQTTWVIEQGLDDPNMSIMKKYSTSIYWSVITLFTTGYGDIVAHNVAEQWVVIVCVAIGSCISAWFIATFSALILEGNNQYTTQRQAVEKALLFCNHFKVDDELKRAIISHTKYYYHHNYVVSSQDEVMECLPLYLQNKVKQKLAKQNQSIDLSEIDFFKYLSPQVIGNLVLKIKSIGCNAGYCLYEKGQIGTELYIQRIGKSKLKKNRREKRSVKRGYIVGEYCLFDKKRKYTLICETWSEFLVLTKKDIYECIENYYGKEKAERKWKQIVGILRKKRKRRKIRFKDDEEVDGKLDISSIDPKQSVSQWIGKVSSREDGRRPSSESMAETISTKISTNLNVKSNTNITEIIDDGKEEEELKQSEIELVDMNEHKDKQTVNDNNIDNYNNMDNDDNESIVSSTTSSSTSFESNAANSKHSNRILDIFNLKRKKSKKSISEKRNEKNKNNYKQLDATKLAKEQSESDSIGDSISMDNDDNQQQEIPNNMRLQSNDKNNININDENPQEIKPNIKQKQDDEGDGMDETDQT